MTGTQQEHILVYGFGPYEEFNDNITEMILGLLEPRPEVTTTRFDTRFDREMFTARFERYSPSILIGLGQHREPGKLRLETTAVNRFGRRGEAKLIITQGGPSQRHVNLDLPITPWTQYTSDAGTYVCNYSMYLALEYCQHTGCRHAFIHVPRGYDPGRAADYLQLVLDGLAD